MTKFVLVDWPQHWLADRRIGGKHSPSERLSLSATDSRLLGNWKSDRSWRKIPITLNERHRLVTRVGNQFGRSDPLTLPCSISFCAWVSVEYSLGWLIPSRSIRV